jgi:hypothetical protein
MDLDAQTLERLTNLLQDRDDVHARAVGQGGGEQLHGRRAVAPSSGRPSFFQLTTTDWLVAMLSLASSTGGARGRLRCLHWYTVR